MPRIRLTARNNTIFRLTSQRRRDRFYQCVMSEQQNLDEYLDQITRRWLIAREYEVTDLEAMKHVVQSLTTEWQSWAATVAVRIIGQGRGEVERTDFEWFIHTLTAQYGATRHPPPGFFLPISEFVPLVDQLQTMAVPYYVSEGDEDDEDPIPFNPIDNDPPNPEPMIESFEPEPMDATPTILESTDVESFSAYPTFGDPFASNPPLTDMVNLEQTTEVPLLPNPVYAYQDYLDYVIRDFYDDPPQRMNDQHELDDSTQYEYSFTLNPSSIQVVPDTPALEGVPDSSYAVTFPDSPTSVMSFESAFKDMETQTSRPPGTQRPLEDDPFLVNPVGTSQLQSIPVSEMPFVTDYYILHPEVPPPYSFYDRPCGHAHLYPMGCGLDEKKEEIEAEAEFGKGKNVVEEEFFYMDDPSGASFSP